MVETKPDLTPVTEADRAVEQAVRERLADGARRRPVLGEEYGDVDRSASDRRWIIDPIDGTKNYVRGMPVWATLLALQDGEEMTVGVVSAPAARSALVGGARARRVRLRWPRRQPASDQRLGRARARATRSCASRASRTGTRRAGSTG